MPPKVGSNIEHVNVGKFLEQYSLAFHHGFGSQRSYVAQPQNRRPIADDRHQVATRSNLNNGFGIGMYQLASCRNPRGISQCEVLLGGNRLGRCYLDFAWLRVPVITQCILFQIGSHRAGLTPGVVVKEASGFSN
jgi:hypothetical protein